MARSDLLLKLVKHGAAGDREGFRRVVEAVISDERQKKHNVLADKISAQLHHEVSKGNGNDAHRSVSNSSQSRAAHNLVREVWPQKHLHSLILSDDNVNEITDFLEEHYRADFLRSYGLEPRHRLLFVGPPGNGKTTAAEAVAESLSLPLYIVQYDALVGSFLGETSARLKSLFEFVRTQPAVIFFDEFETLGKERGDEHDVGEIKRIVSTLLLQIDELPTNTILIVASNHAELLDRAVWRRFQLRLNFPAPSKNEIRQWLKRFELSNDFKWPLTYETLANSLYGLSFSEVEAFAYDVYRKYILRLPDVRPRDVVRARLKQLQVQAGPKNKASGRVGYDGRRETSNTDLPDGKS